MELNIIRDRGRRGLPLERLHSRKLATGEPCDTKTVKHGLEGGGWKSACKGNSLVAHPTSSPVLRGGSGGNIASLPDLISVAMGMLPNDGNPDGRLVMLGVRNHQDEPLFAICRLNDLAPLPDPATA